jgi:hypothetical protein
METTCTALSITWCDSSDPRNLPALLGSLAPDEVVTLARREGLTRYEVVLDVRGADLPGPFSRMDQQAMMKRLIAARQQAEADYGAEKKILEALSHRHHLEGELREAKDAAEETRSEAARLAGRGEDADKEYHAALLAMTVAALSRMVKRMADRVGSTGRCPACAGHPYIRLDEGEEIPTCRVCNRALPVVRVIRDSNFYGNIDRLRQVGADRGE